MAKPITPAEHHAQRVADSATQRQRITAAVQSFPYLMLDVPEKQRARPECIAMDGCARRWDDPYWEKNFPPCERQDCLCSVIQMGQRQIDRHGVKVIRPDEP
ncbi:MAG: phage minor head protein [Rhodocyclaceae bacterium]|nr:phage minor head protein [Rhodocyclaceae bacterium]